MKKKKRRKRRTLGSPGMGYFQLLIVSLIKSIKLL